MGVGPHAAHRKSEESGDHYNNNMFGVFHTASPMTRLVVFHTASPLGCYTDSAHIWYSIFHSASILRNLVTLRAPATRMHAAG